MKLTEQQIRIIKQRQEAAARETERKERLRLAAARGIAIGTAIREQGGRF